MADVVLTGAIFRVKNPATMRSPMPRLLARGRIASATPEPPTPELFRSGAPGARPKNTSALERVVSRGQPPLVPRVPVVAAVNNKSKKNKNPARKAAVVRKAAPQETSHRDENDPQANLLASFDRVVSEGEARTMAVTTRRSSVGSSGSGGSGGSGAASTKSRAKVQSQKPTGRKRPRSEPEEEEEPADEEESSEGQGDENEGEGVSSSDDALETPQRKPQSDVNEDPESADEDGVRVQKRLMYDDTPPAKTKPAKQVAVEAKEIVAEPSPVLVVPQKLTQKRPAASKKAKKEPMKAPLASSGLELLSLSSAATPSRSTRIRTGVLVMTEWYPEWPPQFIGDQLQLVIHGQVLGQDATYAMLRRVSDTQFVSTDNQNVRLEGCIDIDRAQKADVPAVVMGIMVEGIPTQWRQRLESYAAPPDPWIPVSTKAKEKMRVKKAKEAEEALEKQKLQKSIPTPVAKKAVAKTPKSTKRAKKSSSASAVKAFAVDALDTPELEKRSRSGRRITPVLEWWRNERKLTDANFETKIVTGSPAYLPSKRETPPKPSTAAQAARQKIQELVDTQRKSAEWSDAQLSALQTAKAQIPTTHVSFWAEVAKLVPGKSADECRSRSFEELPVAPPRKTTAASKAGAASATKKPLASGAPVKIHRAGSNLFKKQVRQFVHEQEQKNADDLFSFGTPSKDALAGADGLDDLKSPGAPSVEPNRDEDSDDDALLGGNGRELLEKISLSKRDEVDSYVRNLKRGNDAIGSKAVRTVKPSVFETPLTKTKPRREDVHMETEVGGRVIEAIVTPGGTTRVRVSKGSDMDDDEEEDEEEEEEEAELSDAF